MSDRTPKRKLQALRSILVRELRSSTTIRRLQMEPRYQKPRRMEVSEEE